MSDKETVGDMIQNMHNSRQSGYFNGTMGSQLGIEQRARDQNSFTRSGESAGLLACLFLVFGAGFYVYNETGSEEYGIISSIAALSGYLALRWFILNTKVGQVVGRVIAGVILCGAFYLGGEFTKQNYGYDAYNVYLLVAGSVVGFFLFSVVFGWLLRKLLGDKIFNALLYLGLWGVLGWFVFSIWSS